MTDWFWSKEAMLERGIAVTQCFCALNDISMPEITVITGKWAFDACAYYRPREGIVINVTKCALVGLEGRQWSFPGYTVDRTPYGVLQHELGHHVDCLRSVVVDRYRGDYSRDMRYGQAPEEPLTSYCPDDGEWFAEMFRLLVTNPDLLRQIRPHTYARLIADGLRPVFYDSFEDRLKGAPDRTIRSAHRKVWDALPKMLLTEPDNSVILRCPC